VVVHLSTSLPTCGSVNGRERAFADARIENFAMKLRQYSYCPPVSFPPWGLIVTPIKRRPRG